MHLIPDLLWRWQGAGVGDGWDMALNWLHMLTVNLTQNITASGPEQKVYDRSLCSRNCNF